jgi:hypothetical protein
MLRQLQGKADSEHCLLAAVQPGPIICLASTARAASAGFCLRNAKCHGSKTQDVLVDPGSPDRVRYAVPPPHRLAWSSGCAPSPAALIGRHAAYWNGQTSSISLL